MEFQGQGSSEMFEAQSHLYKHIFSYISSMSLKCAIQLNIPDIINNHNQPITLPQLVSALHIHPSKTAFLHRLMRLLVHSGFFVATKTSRDQEEEEEEEEAYELTPSSMLLVKDKIPCLSPYAMAMLDPCFMPPWHLLGDWFRKEATVTPFEAAHGMNLWEYEDESSEFGNLFNEGMASDSEMVKLIVNDCKPVFEGVNSLVDVGGGTGTVAKIITEAFAHVKCTVLDLPCVVADLKDTENLKFIGGDMFESIPSANAILLKRMLISFNDEECVKLLRKCRESIASSGGKVIIIDIVINQDKDDNQLTDGKLYFDLLMMVAVTGRVRYEKEWEMLFLKAGFTHYKITLSFGLGSLIEVYP